MNLYKNNKSAVKETAKAGSKPVQKSYGESIQKYNVDNNKKADKRSDMNNKQRYDYDNKLNTKRNNDDRVRSNKPGIRGNQNSHSEISKRVESEDKSRNIRQAEKTMGACRYMKDCGGCNYKQDSYENELKRKQQLVNDLLKSYCKVEPIIAMDKPDNYRNKVHVVFDHDKKGNPISGVYQERTHRVIPIERCRIHNKKADGIIASIRGMLKSFKIKTYDEDSGYGLLRHVLIRTGYNTGEILVVLILSSIILPSKNNFVKALLKEHPEISTIVINVNDKKTSMVLGDKEQVIYGKGYITDKLCGKTFKISPKSFYQVNPVQTEALYNTAIEYAGLTGKETVIDAYCGIGTIGLVAAEHAKEVIGVELNKDAVRDAISNAKLNEVSNIFFYNADAGEFMSQLAVDKKSADVVFLDPPRAGSTENFLDALASLKPAKVVYVSCNPVTLERDLKYLTKKGYKAIKAKPVDMFPWTEHVETVCLLSKLHEAKHHVNVTLDMDEMDLTAAESKATYEEIKKYVAEHYEGMKVSNLYIAQVKAKYGIIERENYNLPKSGDAKQPQCPKDKEKAIEDALRYFQMK